MRAAAAAAALLAAAAPAGAQPGATESFVVRMGTDTFAVERFTRAPDALTGEIEGPTLGRIVYRVELGPGATTPSLALRAWAPRAPTDGPPAQELELRMGPDSATLEIQGASGIVTRRLPAPPDALLYVNPSFALTEQLVRRALALGGARVEVPLLLLQGGSTVTATVSRRMADSVTISIGGTELHAAVDAEGRLLGGTIPSQAIVFERHAGAVRAPGPAAPIDYGAPPGAPYTAEEVEVPTPAGHVLTGTLTRPAGAAPVPAVVTITGSGPQDRDERIATLPGYRPMRDIADTLARRGIAVLRLDDRGTGRSGGDFAAATSADFADDVRAALAWLRARPDLDGTRLGVVGHSEGGLIGPMVAANDPALRAVVTIAGPAHAGAEVIRYQQRRAVERAFPPQARDSALAAAAAELDSLAKSQPWLRFFLEHDPLPVAERVRAPVLVLQGETDRQVTSEQAELLGAALRAGGNRDVTVRVFPGLNHLMLADPDGDPSGYASLPDRRVDPVVLGALADWLAERLR